MPAAKRRRACGEIEQLPSGSSRIRVYAGLDPLTRKRHYLVETVPADPGAAKKAEKIRTRMPNEVDERRTSRTNTTLDELLDRYLDVLEVEDTTRDGYEHMARLYIRPLLGKVQISRIDGEVLDTFYSQLRRCLARCSRGRRQTDHRGAGEHNCDHRGVPHVCRPLGASHLRQMHVLLTVQGPSLGIAGRSCRPISSTSAKPSVVARSVRVVRRSRTAFVAVVVPWEQDVAPPDHALCTPRSTPSTWFSGVVGTGPRGRCPSIYTTTRALALPATTFRTPPSSRSAACRGEQAGVLVRWSGTTNSRVDRRWASLNASRDCRASRATARSIMTAPPMSVVSTSPQAAVGTGGSRARVRRSQRPSPAIRAERPSRSSGPSGSGSRGHGVGHRRREVLKGLEYRSGCSGRGRDAAAMGRAAQVLWLW